MLRLIRGLIRRHRRWRCRRAWHAAHPPPPGWRSWMDHASSEEIAHYWRERVRTESAQQLGDFLETLSDEDLDRWMSELAESVSAAERRERETNLTQRARTERW